MCVHMHGCMRAEIDFIISGWLLSGMQKPPLWASLGFSQIPAMGSVSHSRSTRVEEGSVQNIMETTRCSQIRVSHMPDSLRGQGHFPFLYVGCRVQEVNLCTTLTVRGMAAEPLANLTGLPEPLLSCPLWFPIGN